MAAPIHLVIPNPAPPPPDTRHKCPFPGCTWLLPEGTSACKRHRPRWAAMTADERAALLGAGRRKP